MTTPAVSETPPISFVSRMLNGDAARAFGAMFLDALVIIAAYVAALLLRFDASVPRVNGEFVSQVLPFIIVAYIAGNLLFGVYRTVWAYGSLGDIIALFRPILVVTLVIFGLNIWVQDRDLPQSVVLIAGALVFRCRHAGLPVQFPLRPPASLSRAQAAG